MNAKNAFVYTFVIPQHDWACGLGGLPHPSVHVQENFLSFNKIIGSLAAWRKSNPKATTGHAFDPEAICRRSPSAVLRSEP